MQIGHLAEIADPDVARVLSWHMSSDIDCVVTRTTQTVLFFQFLKSWLLIMVWKESCQTIWFDFRLKKSTRRLVANNKFFPLTPSSRKAYQTGTSKENTCPLSNTYSVDGQQSWLYDYPAGLSRTLSTGPAGDPKEIPPMPETSWNSLNTDWNVKQVVYYIDTMISVNDESKSFWKLLVQIIHCNVFLYIYIKIYCWF